MGSRHAITSLALVSLAGLAGLAGCSGSLYAHKPTSPLVNDAVTALWASEIRNVAQDGDWILTRSYSLAGDAIVSVTPGEEVSHGSVYDAERGTIIEAMRPVVREVPLESLLARNRYAIVVRPSGLDASARRQTVVRARSAVGVAFDIGGMFGIGSDDAFYCSELLYWASQLDARDPQRIITPADLLDYGEVVYFSGRRDDEQMQRAALGWSIEHARPAIVAAR